MAVKLKMDIDEQGLNFYYDTTTTNISFLQTASDLKKLNIKNNMFFLKLYNRDLLGVDPYAPNISKNMINAIILECMMNPYYFWREVARIPEPGGAIGPGAGSPFILHRGNLASMFCFTHSIDHYLVIPRQCYKTQSTLCELLWLYILGTTNTNFNFSNLSQPAADEMLFKLKLQKDVLPIWLQQKYNFVIEETTKEKKLDKGVDNIRKMINPVTHNTITTKPSATSETKADTIGRGNSAPIQLYDEVEFTNYIGTIIQASGPAYSRSAQVAERNGSIHCRLFTTTPKHNWAVA